HLEDCWSRTDAQRNRSSAAFEILTEVLDFEGRRYVETERLRGGSFATPAQQSPISNTVFKRLLCGTSHERASAFRPETAHCHSLISHSRPAVSLSCASGLGGLCSWSKKYTPLTFATSGEVASHTRVSAPFSGLRDTGLSIVIPKSISRPLLRLNPVATSPGWKQFAVTPVPSSRRASSVVNRMLASLVSQ